MILMLNEDIDEYRQRRDLLLDQITESTKLQKNFVHLLCKDLFLRYYLLYQEYIERMFIVYSLNFDKIASKTQKLKLDTYIMPTNEEHAKELMGGIKDSGATIRIDWSNCDNVLKRAHLYFGEDSPFRIIISSQKQSLQEACYIRNYIAHRSPESYHRFKKM